jgi:pentose-5-phosphate-3-epimerase
MNPFFNMMNNPMINIVKQVQQIKQNPNQLATLLQQRGMINEQQAKEIQKMGGNYEQIGQYLMNNGRMPTNVQQYQNQVNQIENMMHNQ